MCNKLFDCILQLFSCFPLGAGIDIRLIALFIRMILSGIIRYKYLLSIMIRCLMKLLQVELLPSVIIIGPAVWSFKAQLYLNQPSVPACRL